MPESGKAVFLSYASQDAAAARRIAEALRAAGVEVWFDQSELVGGDAWDQKIRKQINSCALFIPIISASTQARAEGYFRLEWRLADKRTELMGKSKAFLLPVCIDDTRDADADVPDSFLAVQWTRLPGGEATPVFCARVKRLLDGGAGQDLRIPSSSSAAGFGDPALQSASRPPISDRGEGAPVPARSRLRWPWVAGAIAAVVVGYVLVSSLNSPWSDPATVLNAMAEQQAAAAPVSAARGFVAKAWEQMNKPELARAELEIADGFCRRAVEIDPNDAEAWAAWSQADSWTIYHNIDDTPARRESARTKAAKALQLAPASFESRLAHACQIVRSGGDAAVSDLVAEADRLLRVLLREKPDEPRTLLALGILQRNTGDVAGFRETFGRMARIPAYAVQAWNELAWAEYFAGNIPAASAAIETSIAHRPYWGNLGLKAILAQWWFGDLDLAKATVDRMPTAVLQEDIGVSFRIELAYWRREPQVMLQILAGVPRDWLRSNGYDGPTAALAALAHRMAGREAAAQVQLQAALRLVEERLAARPDSGFLLFWKGQLLALLDRRPEAAEAFRLARELGMADSNFADPVVERVLLGDLDGAVDAIEQQLDAGGRAGRRMFAAHYRLNPRFDPLGGNPRFQALLARMEADPRFSPKAGPAPSSFLPSPSARPVAEPKSIAVLAFANLSDDKNNEYFSDGISEELLNVLAKVPGLKVSARTSAFFFKGKQVPIAEIARQLGVAYVVEGSVRKAGERVRITAQLIKAEDGFHVWSDTFTRDLKDIFAVQDEIAGLIAQNLQLKMDLAPVKRVVNPEAHRLVLEGRHYWLQRTDEAFARAQELYAKALEIDPGFADAHAGIADVFVVRGWYHALSGATVTVSDFARAREEADLALRLDPTLVAPHATLAAVNYNEGRFQEAELAFKEALRLNPNYAVALHWRSHLLMAQGRPDEALASIERSIELDPFSSITLVIYANWLEHTGRNADAVAVTDRALALRADQFVPLYGTRALVLWNVGRREEAVAAARVVTRDPKQEPRWWVDGSVVYVLRQAGFVDEARAHLQNMLAELSEGSTARAAVFAGMDEPERAIAELARPERRLAGPGETFYTTSWETTRRDPRYAELVTRLGRGEAYRRAQETLQRMKGDVR